MSVKQKWSDVWPGPRTFHPSSVPLPLRQGYLMPKDNKRPPPDKFANAELMKIPNFLHLTPPAIKQQCEAIRKYCSAWPAGLETDEKCDKHFPIEYISSDYCHGLPTIRNPLSRIISIRVSFDFFSPLNIRKFRGWSVFFLFLFISSSNCPLCRSINMPETNFCG